MKELNFEIYADEEGPYGNTLSIRRSGADVDGQRVFATFKEAKRELRKILLDEEDELQERLAVLLYNRQDLSRLRESQLQDD